MTEFDRRDHHIQSRQSPLQFQPLASAPAGLIGRNGIFDHQAFVATRPRGVKFVVKRRDIVNRFARDRRSRSLSLVILISSSSLRASRLQFVIYHHAPRCIKQIPRDEDDRSARQ